MREPPGQLCWQFPRDQVRPAEAQSQVKELYSPTSPTSEPGTGNQGEVQLPTPHLPVSWDPAPWTTPPSGHQHSCTSPLPMPVVCSACLFLDIPWMKQPASHPVRHLHATSDGHSSDTCHPLSTHRSTVRVKLRQNEHSLRLQCPIYWGQIYVIFRL